MVLDKRDAVLVFPEPPNKLDRCKLSVLPSVVFRPIGFLLWGLREDSWLHSFRINGREQLATRDGFRLQHFGTPARSFIDLALRFRTVDGKPVELDAEQRAGGFVALVPDLVEWMKIPAHVQLDFVAASENDPVEIEISGGLDRAVAWGVAAVPSSTQRPRLDRVAPARLMANINLRGER